MSGRQRRKKRLEQKLATIVPISKSQFDPPRPLDARAPEGDFLSARFPLMDRWANHPGSGLTPRRIVSIFRAAEVGFPQEQCDLFEDVIESDAHLRSQIEGRITAVAGKDWIVQPGGDAEADVAAATALEDVVCDVPAMGEVFAHLLTYNFSGYAGAEMRWELVDVDGAAMFAPTWIAQTPHRRFVFDLYSGLPRILTVEQPSQGVELPQGQWIWAQRRGRLGAMAGLMRTCTWWSLFKRMAVRDWIILAERFGLPYVTGQYGDEMPESEKATLRKAVAAMGKDGFACFSKSGEITIHALADGGRAADIHGALTQLCNSEISKLVTGSTLMSETQGPGSFALGRVQQDRSFDLISADAQFLSEVFDRHVARPFCLYNGLSMAETPVLKFHLVRDVDPKIRMELFAAAIRDLGLSLDADQVRQEFQFKPPTGEALEPVAPPQVAPPGGGDPLKQGLSKHDPLYRLLRECGAFARSRGVATSWADLRASLVKTLGEAGLLIT